MGAYAVDDALAMARAMSIAAYESATRCAELRGEAERLYWTGYSDGTAVLSLRIASAVTLHCLPDGLAHRCGCHHGGWMRIGDAGLGPRGLLVPPGSRVLPARDWQRVLAWLGGLPGSSPHGYEEMPCPCYRCKARTGEERRLMEAELTWSACTAFTYDDYPVMIEKSQLVPYLTDLPPVYRVTTEIAGVTVRRHGAALGAALCALLDDLDEAVLTGLLDDDGDGDDEEERGAG